jgi:hypothetical protein
MLELRPTCEHCNVALPPNSNQAMICSFECTFCKECVKKILHNVCPNCGGGFSVRPIRPHNNLKNDNYLGKYPGSDKQQYRPVNLEKHQALCNKAKDIPPDQR